LLTPRSSDSSPTTRYPQPARNAGPKLPRERFSSVTRSGPVAPNPRCPIAPIADFVAAGRERVRSRNLSAINGRAFEGVDVDRPAHQYHRPDH
jgi:hypothetical protein